MYLQFCITIVNLGVGLNQVLSHNFDGHVKVAFTTKLSKEVFAIRLNSALTVLGAITDPIPEDMFETPKLTLAQQFCGNGEVKVKFSLDQTES